MSSKARLFIAVSIPGCVLDQIGALQRPLRQQSADVRWVRPEAMHITLKFLGDTSVEWLDDIETVMASAVESVHPFEIRIQEAGAFPNMKRPRVLWLGVRDNGSLKRMAGHLNAGLTELGFESEKRDFKAHLTLGRVKSLRGIEAVTGRVRESAFSSDAFRATEIHLIKSILKPAGAEYNPLRTVQFKG